MDPEEVDFWYEEQKERLTDEYQSKLRTSKNPEKLKKEFLKSMKDLHIKYEQSSDKSVKSNLTRHFRNHKINMLKKRIMKPLDRLKERFEKEES